MDNPELILAKEFVVNTDRNIFLTGKAGTGKTTFLRTLSENQFKRTIVVAPTGVAAINAHGVTIHSFFQLPFGPLVPGNNEEAFFRRKMRAQKINIIRSIDLLIIDEISMVRADLLDAIDTVLRRYRDRSRPFGGAQVLMIGDIHQLAPVTKAEEWNLLAPHYETPYFFSSNSFLQADVIPIELRQIYRQDDEEFIGILEKVRNNKIDTYTLNELNKRYSPDTGSKPGEGYITLTTHNAKAESMNEYELGKLSSATTRYKAKIEGDFPEYAYPTLENLKFKIGAQVMFVKNDPSPEKLYYNGKIGKISALKKDSVTVECDGDEIEVTKVLWENVKYSLNRDNQKIEEEVIGSFEQIPLKLAWAITIHKSQGLTFDKVIIDAQASFAHGQTYVALSRCRTLEGIILKSKINMSSVISDKRVLRFSDDAREKPPDEKFLYQSKRDFQIKMIRQLFDFSPLINPIQYAKRIAEINHKVLIGNHMEKLSRIEELVNELLAVSQRFEEQIMRMQNILIIPENDPHLTQRLAKAIAYYQEFTTEKIKPEIDTLIYTTDNKEVEKDFKKQIDNISDFVNSKIFCYRGLGTEFSVLKYLELRAKSNLIKENKRTGARELVKATDHPELFSDLREYRHRIAEENEIDHFQVFTQATLYEMCEKLPSNLRLLKKINGIGKVRLRLYGEDIIKIIRKYCNDNNIEIPDDDPEPYVLKKPAKTSTYQITLELFKTGKKPIDIAKERNLALSTIEGHLAKLILDKDISLFDLIPKQKYEKFISLAADKTYDNLTELKGIVGDEFSFGELRMMVNHRELKIFKC